MVSASTPSVNEPTRPHFSPHRKAKAKSPISEKLVSSDISHVAFASVLLGDNLIIIIMNLSQETKVFGGRKIVMVDFKFDALYS